MASKNTAVFGIYKNVAQAERAVETLRSAGYANNDISVLLTDAQTSHDFAHEKGTKAPEGTAAGAA
ncbi:MAG: general stress protein, partial [Bryobacteraceae bacterium]